MDKYLKNKKIKYKFQGDIEPHEVMLDKFAKKHEEQLGLRERRFEVPLLRKSIFIYLGFCFLVIFLLFARTAYIQIANGKQLSVEAESNRYIFHKIQAERGVIYDDNMKQLVYNVPVFRLVYNKDSGPQGEAALREVANILKENFADLKSDVDAQNSNLVVVDPNLDHSTLIILETKIDNLTGFSIQQNLIRDYPEGTTFSDVIGYMGKVSKDELEGDPTFYSPLDYVGRDGLEKTYEDFLRKNPGQAKIERDAMGDTISSQIVELPKSGDNLKLWLDAGLQEKATAAAEQILKDSDAKSAVVIAMDPNTGGVLALVSIPSFDNNAFSQGDVTALGNIFSDPNQPLFNRAISGIGFPTGSTIKPLIASAALQEKVIKPDKYILTYGYIEVPNEYDPSIIYRYNDNNNHGWVDMRQAIAESCNVYFYTIGGGFKDYGVTGLGPQRIEQYLGLFGWNQKTGIDLPSEGEGVLPTLDQNWRLGDTYHLSIGQGPFSITPIQVAAAYSAIANGGKLLQPEIVHEILDDQNNVIKEIQPVVVRDNFIDSQNLEVVKEGMRQGVTGQNSPLATSLSLNDLPVKVAAKTGTAQTSQEDVYENWISLFAPYDNPKIVLTVMVEDVHGVKAVATPIAHEILQWYFSQEQGL